MTRIIILVKEKSSLLVYIIIELRFLLVPIDKANFGYKGLKTYETLLTALVTSGYGKKVIDDCDFCGRWDYCWCDTVHDDGFLEPIRTSQAKL